MSIEKRLKKIESRVNKTDCLCTKSALNELMRGQRESLGSCPRYQSRVEEWKKIAEDAAKKNENWTDNPPLAITGMGKEIQR